MIRESTLDRRIRAIIAAYTPAVWGEKRSPARGSKSGIPDWTGCGWGWYWAIESKHPVTKPHAKEDQKFHLLRIEKAGGKTLVATDAESVRAFFRSLEACARERDAHRAG